MLWPPQCSGQEGDGLCERVVVLEIKVEMNMRNFLNRESARFHSGLKVGIKWQGTRRIVGDHSVVSHVTLPTPKGTRV